MLHTLRFSLQNAVYFIMLPFFGSCIIHILHTGVLKFKCKTPVLLPAIQVQVLIWTGDSGSNPERAHGDEFLICQ
jgi:hypothetical protein